MIRMSPMLASRLGIKPTPTPPAPWTTMPVAGPAAPAPAGPPADISTLPASAPTGVAPGIMPASLMGATAPQTPTNINSVKAQLAGRSLMGRTTPTKQGGWRK